MSKDYNPLTIFDQLEHVTELDLCYINGPESHYVELMSKSPSGYEVIEGIKTIGVQPCDNISFTLIKSTKSKEIEYSILKNSHDVEKMQECIGNRKCNILDEYGEKRTEELIGMCPKMGAMASDLTRSFGKTSAELFINTAFKNYKENDADKSKIKKI